MASTSIARRRLLTGTAALLAAPAFIRPARAATTLKISTSFPNDPKFSAARIWYDIFVVRLKTATDGQIATTFYPDNQLGQEADVVNQVKLGVVDAMLVGTPIWTNLVPEFGVFDLGYLFQDYDHLLRGRYACGRESSKAARSKGRGALSGLGKDAWRPQLLDQICIHGSGRSCRAQDSLPAQSDCD